MAPANKKCVACELRESEQVDAGKTAGFCVYLSGLSTDRSVFLQLAAGGLRVLARNQRQIRQFQTRNQP